MKAILMSIKPEWVEKILNGSKTVEIRKTKPKCDLPIKVYIYCTKDSSYKLLRDNETGQCFKGITSGNETIHSDNTEYGMNCEYETQCCTKLNGKVVAEFTLNKITKHEKNYIDIEDELCYNFLTEDLENSGFIETHTDLGILNAVLDFTSFTNNYGNGKPLYAWHIDNLIIYDTPKELSDFKKENKCHYADYEEGCCFENCTFYDLKDCDGIYSKVTVAPQSWYYVEEKGEKV